MVQALTELLRRAQAPPAPRSRACEPSTPRRSRGRPPGRPAGPCRKKQQAIVVAEAAVTIPKSEPPPPVVPVKHRTGSWKCKEGPGPGPGTPKRGGQSGRGGRGGRGRGRGGLPIMIKFVSKAKRVKMGQLSLGFESGQGQEQHEESWQDASQGRVGSGQGEGPCWRKEQKLEEEGEEEEEEEKDKEEEDEEKQEKAVAEEETMLAEEKEETKLPSPPLTPPGPLPPLTPSPPPPPSTSPPPPLCPPPPPVSPLPLPSPPPPPAPEEQEESLPPVVPTTCSRKRGRPPLTPSQRAEREAARAVPEGTSPPTPTPSTTMGGPLEDSPTMVPKSTTFLKNIRQFIMPVVSARSSRVIKTPRRFMDEDPPKPPKVEVSPLRPPVATSPLAPQEPAPAPSPPRAPTPPTPIPLPEKRRSILREPTFRWTSLTRELPPPPPAPPPAPPPIPVTPSRRPLLLRAPQFTPSEAHLKIYESVLTTPPLGAPETPEPEPPPTDDSPAEPEPRAAGRTNHLSLPRFAPVVVTPVKAEVPPPGAPAPNSGQQQPQAQLQQPLQALHTQLLPQALPPQQPQSPPQERARITSLGSLPLSGVEEKMFSLLKRAKVQLFKIDQQQQQKVASTMPVSVPQPCPGLPGLLGASLPGPVCPHFPASDPVYSPTSPALGGKWRRSWGLPSRSQIEVLSGLKMNRWKRRERDRRYGLGGGPSEEGWLPEHKGQLPTHIPGFSSTRAPSPLCKAPASNTSAAMLLWPWVRPGPWCLKTSPASVLSRFGIVRISPRRVGTGLLWGNWTAVSSLG